MLKYLKYQHKELYLLWLNTQKEEKKQKKQRYTNRNRKWYLKKTWANFNSLGIILSETWLTSEYRIPMLVLYRPAFLLGLLEPPRRISDYNQNSFQKERSLEAQARANCFLTHLWVLFQQHREQAMCSFWRGRPRETKASAYCVMTRVVYHCMSQPEEPVSESYLLASSSVQ